MKLIRGMGKARLVSRMFAIAVAVAIVIGFFTPSAIATPPSPPSGKHWVPALAEEFNGSSLDSSSWSTCYHWFNAQYQGCTNAGNNELEWYKSSQVSVGNGHATLTAMNTSTTGVVEDSQGNDVVKNFPYRSGMISTGDLNGWIPQSVRCCTDISRLEFVYPKDGVFGCILDAVG